MLSHAEAYFAYLFVPQGFTPLHTAIRRKGKNIVKVVTLLVQAGASAATAEKTVQVSCLHSILDTRPWHSCTKGHCMTPWRHHAICLLNHVPDPGCCNEVS